VAQTLLSNGYSADKLKVLRGGFISWQSLGYPVATAEAPPAGTPGASNIQIQPGQPGQPIQVVPGGQIQVGTAVPGGSTSP
jgi:hypothetical protein